MTAPYDADVIEKIGSARVHALAAVTERRPDVPAPTPEDIARDRLRQLATISPGAAVAEATLAVGTVPIPLDGTLRPSGDPMTTFGAILQHAMGHPDLGVGIALGAQPGGAFRVAVRGTAAAWEGFLTEHAEVRMTGEAGDVPHRSFRDTGRGQCRVRWSPTTAPIRTSPVVVGPGALLEQAEDFMITSRSGAGQIGWVAWSVAVGWAVAAPMAVRPSADGDTYESEAPLLPPTTRYTFKSHPLGHGLELVADGVLPIYARRPDGWVLSVDHLPQTGEMPAWLLDAFGAKVVTR